jgi:hypothetical protein
MGKRELLLISGFAVIGVLVYQLTMPASADTGGGFAAWWARVRSHFQENRVERRYERKAEVPATDEVKILSLRLARGSVNVVGESRDSIAVELSGAVLAADEAAAAEVEKGIALTAQPEGGTVNVAVEVPDRDELARRPRPSVRLTIRVPSRLSVEVRTGGGELAVTDVAAVHLREAEGNIRLGNIAGAVSGEVERGSIEIEQVGSVALKARRCDARVARVAGAFELEANRCEVRARAIEGASTLDIENVEGELEDPVGPVRIKGKGGAFYVRGGRGPIEADTDRTTIHLQPAVPVPVTATVEHDTIEITLPRGGLLVDAVATDGDIRSPHGLLTVERGEDVVKASGTVLGGGPRVQLRTTRGDIVVR